MTAAMALLWAQCEAKARAMVNRWEPDVIGTDRIMWENARAAIAKAEGAET